MSIRQMAVCFGLALTPGFAVTAHATYTVIVLPDAGGESDSVVEAINNVGQSIEYSDTARGDDAILLGPKGGIAATLKDPGGQGVEFALALNAKGQSVGYAGTAGGGTEPVLWQPSGTAIVLGKGGASGKAVAINVNGESVGYIKTTNGYDAILWHSGGAARVLGDPAGKHFAKALAIDDSGHSAGYACTTVTVGKCVDAEAVLWAPGGKATPLLDVKGGVGNYEAVAIDKTEYSVGWAATGTTSRDAVRWSPIGTATVLQGLKGSSFSEAVADNNVGQSIGYSDTAKGDEAILWGPKGGIAATLQDPGGQGVEFALALNDKGQSVGYADIAGGGREAVLWQPSGKATNLGKLLGPDWSDTEAVGINDLGDIIGYGHYAKGTVSGTFSFLLTPGSTPAESAVAVTATAFAAGPRSAAVAPEPSTWAMLVVGFAGLGFVGYRAARKREARREVLA